MRYPTTENALAICRGRRARLCRGIEAVTVGVPRAFFERDFMLRQTLVGQSGGRAVVAILASICFVAGSFALALLFSQSADAVVEGSVTIDLARPATGITDPLAGMMPLPRDCTVKQIDVNTAAESQIASALHLANPTAARVVAGRPWQRAADLISVPGVGPQLLDTLNRDACATPTELPPATPRACTTGTTAVDLQSATAAQISETTRLASPVVQRLIAARPLPQDPYQLSAPRVPGLSDPTVRTLLQRGLICITPAPFDYQGKSWRWVAPTHGAIVRATGDPRFALFVPPGRVGGTVGAWATAMPAALVAGALPSGDFHIYGEWTPEVAVRLPIAPGSRLATAFVAHERSDGEMAASFAGGLAGAPTASGDTVVAAANTLSTFTTYTIGSCADPNHSPTLICPYGEATRDQLWMAYGTRQVGRWVPDWTLPATDCVGSDLRARTIGFTDGSMACSSGMDGARGRWTFTNKSKLLVSSGIVYRADPHGGTFEPSRRKAEAPDAIFTNEVVDQIFDAGFLPPESGLTVHKEVNSGDTVLSADGDRDGTGFWWTVQQITSLADLAFEHSPLAIQTKARLAFQACAVQVGLIAKGGDKAADALKCITEAAVDFLTATAGIQREAVDAETDPAKKAAKVSILSQIASAGEVVKKGLKVLIGLDALVSASQLGARGLTITMRTLRPPPPKLPGGLDALEGPARDGTFIARTEDGDAYLVLKGHDRAVAITTGTLFNCLALSRFVLDDINVSGTNKDQILVLHGGVEIPVLTSQALTCNPTAGGQWTYTGARNGGNVPDNVVIKEPDWLGRAAYHIAADGNIFDIQGGGVYLCLTASYPVIYNFPMERITSWPGPWPDLPSAKCP